MKVSLILLYILCCISTLKSQTCNCSATFDWMVNTFEKNDAGFKYVIDKKGEDEYKKLTLKLRDKAVRITKAGDCRDLMEEWQGFFRSGHIFIALKDPGSPAGKEPSENEIRERYKNEKTIDLSTEQLILKLEKKTNKDIIEGIWAYNNYTVGIIEDDAVTKKFNVFIIQSDGIYWMPKQLKAELLRSEDGKSYSGSYYMRDHSRQDTKAHMAGTALMYMGGYWQRLYPKTALSQKEQQLVAFSSALPMLKQLGPKTLYLRIPSFQVEQKTKIDSVLKKHDALIRSTPNLIIDVRNGTGGSDNAYAELIPYLYTNPIRGVGVQLYATELNARAYEKYALQYSDSENINYCNNIAKRMRKNPGKFITQSDEAQKTTVDSSMNALPFPARVGIVFNHNNGSTDEQFLLDAKQSTKVKTFGTPTGGMLDISNMNQIESPDGKFVLGYCMSKSYRIPDYCIDGVGIQPDYFIDDGIALEDWINYVQSILEK